MSSPVRKTALFAIYHLSLSLAAAHPNPFYPVTFYGGGCQFWGHDMGNQGEGFEVTYCVHYKCDEEKRQVLVFGCPPPKYYLPEDSFGSHDNKVWPNCCPGHEV
uniref:Single domain-containing protein n=1 Tax=Amblyomma triste TaxID=251400 RepID=A0A023GBX4_AMBTT